MSEIEVVYAELPETNFFVYKQNKYPFNMKIFCELSNYFSSNSIIPKNNQIINLIDEYDGIIELSDDSIQDFVGYFQHLRITFKKETVSSILMLSKKFMVPHLIQAAEKYISNHKEDFLIQFIAINQEHPNFNTEPFEEMISKNLIEYIQNDQLLSLPITIIHRVLTKYQLKNQNQESSIPIIDFVFKCFDKYGRAASVLLEHIDFGKEPTVYLKKLLDNKYSKIIDFHFVNNAYLKTLYDIQSDLIRKEEIIEQQQKDISNLLNNDIKQLREEIDRMKTQQTQLIQKVDTLNNQIDNMKKISARCFYLGKQNKKGILSMLSNSVELNAGGCHNPSSPLKNILSDNNDYFYNYYRYDKTTRIGCDFNFGKSEDDSWIEFDFGPNNKIDLHSYFIRTNGHEKNAFFHSKTWRIVGYDDKNDKSSWIQLDRQVDNASLNGNLESYFVCNEKKFGLQNCHFRYVRFIQEDTWGENPTINKYNIFIRYFELYGDIYSNE
ncbi:hypothetical protein M9Y10_035545 [Tritrichomonas musculus]|uniref:F5/8 type C domain-containing protein n=1 Tax=Tritrichomonas musculus TaxID=1915356 RepID=A0ABR2KHX5_9EUKA